MGLNHVPDLPADVPFCPGLSSVMGEAGVVGFMNSAGSVCLFLLFFFWLACLCFLEPPFLPVLPEVRVLCGE